MVIRAELHGHIGEGNRGDEEAMDRLGVKEKNQEGQVVDFTKGMKWLKSVPISRKGRNRG